MTIFDGKNNGISQQRETGEHERAQRGLEKIKGEPKRVGWK